MFFLVICPFFAILFYNELRIFVFLNPFRSVDWKLTFYKIIFQLSKRTYFQSIEGKKGSRP